ncbi:MAG: Gfo/Idh/MocA family oxidoreductase [Clostridiales bacterium]|nr:Gfo/Idh/MocA family oxidoreductase [Clostridiales bacterium]
MVRFGIIGTGKIAEKFYQANRFGKGFELTAVYSRSLERAKEFGFRKGDLSYYDDLDAFAHSEVIDAVYIASPNCCHHDQAIAMMRAGKHVLCEKPMASNYEEAAEMFRVAEEEDVILMEAMRSIYTPGFQKMTEHMKNLGRIRRATIQYCQYSSRYDNFKRDIIENAFRPELSNGALMDIGVYTVACMIRLFGAPKSIKAMGVRLSNGVDGEGTILMEYEGMIGEAVYSKITDAATSSQIQGEEACMTVREMENVKDLTIVSRRNVKQVIHFEQSDNVLNHETDAFLKIVRTGIGWEKARDITLETMKVLDEARRQIGIVFPADENDKKSDDDGELIDKADQGIGETIDKADQSIM